MPNLEIDNKTDSQIDDKTRKKSDYHWCIQRSKRELDRRERKILLFLFFLWGCLLLCSLLFFGSGCSTPFYSTDNRFLLLLPGTMRNSDLIEGVIPPSERIKMIEEKGEKGKKASQEEKEILILQLVQEYNRSLDPNVRRASIDSLSDIVSTMPSVEAEQIFERGFRDSVLGIRISSINAWGQYCYETGDSKGNNGGSTLERKRSAEKLAAYYRELAYSIDAGAKRINEERKDLRLTILRNMTKFKATDSPEVMAILEEGLQGEKLDDGALQLASMRALETICGKKYGMNVENWLAYIEYTQGKRTTVPEELSFSERLPRPDLSMFK